MIEYPPRLDLARLPTPLTRMDRLSAEFPGVDIWVKHDEMTGVEVSGNKVRKLEFIFAEALAQGCAPSSLRRSAANLSRHRVARARLGLQGASAGRGDARPSCSAICSRPS